MCMCMCSSLYGSLRNGSSFLFRVRSICKPANGALVLLLADNPDDVVGTVTANMRRLHCNPYPGDRPERPMAFRRDGLPEGPAPLNLQKDLAVRAAYIQINGAPPCAPRQFPRTPHPACDTSSHHARRVAPRTYPGTVTTLTLSLSSPAAKSGATACPGLSEVECKSLLERIASGSITAADKKLINRGHSAMGVTHSLP